jgi:parvulin-like peptidyl-prolyl isomerase
MYDKAMAEGFKLTDAEQKNLDNLESSLELYAAYSGFSNVNGYLRNTYGDTASFKTYAEYTKVATIAQAYTAAYYNSLTFTEQDYRDYESKEDRYKNYNSYTYSYYYITVSDYLTFLGGGTEVKGEDGKTTLTYTDEQKEAARKAAEEAAKALAVAENNTLEKFNLAIGKLDLNKDKKDIKATESKHTLYAGISNEDIKKWVADDARKQGDMTTIEVKSGTGDDATVSGYYVVLFDNCNENKQPLANVQHILVKFTGGKKDSVTGKTTYTEEEKKAAKDKAQAILDEFLKGEKKDSAAFGELAKAKSEDTGSKASGGLIENIFRHAGYVEPFTDWALEGHKPGDTGLIESEYGYHVMFYKEDGAMTYRDYMIDIDLKNEALTEWEEGLTKDIAITIENPKYLNREFSMTLS